jgi:hypothetical protein
MNKNSVLVNKIIAMGVTDSEEAAMIMDHYLKTGILTRSNKEYPAEDVFGDWFNDWND